MSSSRGKAFKLQDGENTETVPVGGSISKCALRITTEGKNPPVPGTDYVLKSGALTQIETRPHTQLQEIGTRTHAQIDSALNDLIGGVYTPTLSNVANLSASTAYECQYVRLGDTVIVSGVVDVDPTNTATETKLGISLPVASNIANANECAGVAFASGITGQGAAIRGDAANNRAEMVWISGDVSNQPMYFNFTYRIIA